VQRASQRRSGFGVLIETAGACGRRPAAHGAQDGAGGRIAGSHLRARNQFSTSVSVTPAGAGLPYRRSA